MKKLTIEIKDDGIISFSSAGLTDIEIIGLLTHYKNVIEMELIQKYTTNDTLGKNIEG